LHEQHGDRRGGDDREGERDQKIEQPEHQERREHFELRHVRHRLDEEEFEHAESAGGVRGKRRRERGEKHAEHDEEAGIASLGHLLVVAVLVGALSVLFEVAYRSVLPSLVGKRQLVVANARLSLSASIAEVTGPGLSGVLVQVLTAPITILIDALTFFASALLLNLIRAPEARPVEQSERQGIRKELAEGLRAVLDSPILRAFAGRTATSTFFGGFYGALYSLYLIRVLGIGPAGVGVTVAFGGIGELIGAALAPRLLARLGIGRTLLAAFLFQTVTSLLIPLARGPLALAVAMLMASQIFVDMMYPIVGVPEMSLRQTLVPDRLLGRVNATMQFIGQGVYPAGVLLGGALGEIIGIRQALWVAAIGGFFALPWVLFSPIPHLRGLPAAGSDG